MKRTLVLLLTLSAGVAVGRMLPDRPPTDPARAESVVVLRADRNHNLEVKRPVRDGSATNNDQDPKEWVLIFQAPGCRPYALVCEEVTAATASGTPSR